MLVTMVGGTALRYNGLASHVANVLQHTTPYVDLDGYCVGYNELYYRPELDVDKNHIRTVIDSSVAQLRVPTAERAICDTLRYFEDMEGLFAMEAINRYRHLHTNDFSALLRIADEYGVKMQMISWIEEAAEYDGY